MKIISSITHPQVFANPSFKNKKKTGKSLANNVLLKAIVHLYIVILQTLLSKATYNWEIKRFVLKRKTDRGSAPNTKSQAFVFQTQM